MTKTWPYLALALVLFSWAGFALLQSSHERRQASAVPRMTCDQLLQHGPGNHSVITLTDASLCGEDSVGERDGESGHLELYHPLYPMQLEREPKPDQLTLLLCILDEQERRGIRDGREQQRRLGQPGCGEITGEVSHGAAQVAPWAREGLAQAYPGLQLDNCWVLTVGRHAPSLNHARVLVWQGLLAGLAGVGLLGWLTWSHLRTPLHAKPE